MTRGMYRWAQLQAQTGDSSAYLSFFSHVPPEEGPEKFGAYHGAEVMYAFDNLGADSDADSTEAAYRRPDLMSTSWRRFVLTVNPQAPRLRKWLPYDPRPDTLMGLSGHTGPHPQPP